MTYNTETCRIAKKYNKMILLIPNGLVTYFDHNGVERVKGKPNDLVGMWIGKETIEENVQLSLF